VPTPAEKGSFYILAIFHPWRVPIKGMQNNWFNHATC
jgi:hypothetical protein